MDDIGEFEFFQPAGLKENCSSLVPPESCPQQAVVDASNEMVLTLLPNFVSNLTLMDLNSTTH